MNRSVIYSRAELIDWVNSVLGLNYSKLHQCANGAAFCQIIDYMDPGSINLSEVNFNASSEEEILKNYEQLQYAFDRKQIKKTIPTKRLAHNSYQSTLEMLQWIKGYFDANFKGGGYDAPSKREECKKSRTRNTGFPPKTPLQNRERNSSKMALKQNRSSCKPPFNSFSKPTSSFSHPKTDTTSSSLPKKSTKNSALIQSKTPSKASFQTLPSTARKVEKPLRNNIHEQDISRTVKKPPQNKNRSFSNIASTRAALQNEEEEKLKLDINILNQKIIAIQNESQEFMEDREFYYKKVQQVEEFCKGKKKKMTGTPFINSILEIIYDSQDDTDIDTNESESDELEI